MHKFLQTVSVLAALQLPELQLPRHLCELRSWESSEHNLHFKLGSLEDDSSHQAEFGDNGTCMQARSDEYPKLKKTQKIRASRILSQYFFLLKHLKRSLANEFPFFSKEETSEKLPKKVFFVLKTGCCAATAAAPLALAPEGPAEVGLRHGHGGGAAGAGGGN